MRDSPESHEMSEAKEGTFSSGGCLPLFGVSLWLCAGETTHGGDISKPEPGRMKAATVVRSGKKIIIPSEYG